MKTKLVIAALMSVFLALGLYAKGPKGGDTRIDDNIQLQSDFSDVAKGDTMLVACKVCNAMTLEAIDTDEKAAMFCEEGKTLTCSSCNAKAVVVRTDKARPRPQGKGARKVIYVNEHGDECLIVSKVVSKS